MKQIPEKTVMEVTSKTMSQYPTPTDLFNRLQEIQKNIPYLNTLFSIPLPLSKEEILFFQIAFINIYNSMSLEKGEIIVKTKSPQLDNKHSQIFCKIEKNNESFNSKTGDLPKIINTFNQRFLLNYIAFMVFEQKVFKKDPEGIFILFKNIIEFLDEIAYNKSLT